MNPFTFYNPTKILFGKGKISGLGCEIRPYGKKVLLVYGGGSVKRSGLYDQVMEQLNSMEAQVIELPGIEPNPRISSVREGVRLCREHGIEFILAVGGGSVVDASKGIAAGARYEGDPWDFYSNQTPIHSALPLGAVLTLAATGTEMNGNSVVSNWEEKLKLSFGSIHVYPRFSVLDPTYTFSVPRDQTVNGIVDMMAHVFEQYFSLTADTPLQERLCESILQTVVETGEGALADPQDYNARANLMWCGTMALNGGLISVGMANDWASHGIEHEVSAIYDIPHGAGLAILFPNWMKYVYDARPDRFAQFATRVWGIPADGKTAEELALAGIEATRAYFNRIGAPSTLGHYGIGGENLERMAELAVRYGPIGSFKPLHKEDVLEILKLSL
ncbi:MAG: Fe-dependent oxidoreductase, alcohol dehydrogenase [Paenibacillaceae bacterium]|jgi:alcohol dehydrogenase YqhD (iron-dependent ADH family)|nr:Fe-dependent oxidoreductase, alcohol dehydrogenase [Paenibacillaceae bacterium]